MALPKKKLTVKEKLDYVPAFLSIGATAVAAPITGLVRGPSGADTYRHHIIHSIIRKFNSRLNSIQAQKSQPTFEETYDKWCKQNKVQPDLVETSTGVRGFWVGDKQKAKHVIVYFHGGGFAIDGSEGHITFWSDIQKYLASNSVHTAFFYVLYTLTTELKFPTQLREAIAAIQYLVEECGRSPSELILSGDSAGANVSLAALLHMSQPCPEIENKFTISQDFKALILMAPWVSFDTDWPSFTTNKYKDYIEADVEGRWSAEYIGVEPKPRAANRDITTGNPDTHPRSPYAEPSLAPAEVWADAKCEKIFVVYGSSEALRDSIEDWIGKYTKGIGEEKVKAGGIEVCMGQNEVHIAPIVWPMFGEKKETETGAALKQWMMANLR